MAFNATDLAGCHAGVKVSGVVGHTDWWCWFASIRAQRCRVCWDMHVLVLVVMECSGLGGTSPKFLTRGLVEHLCGANCISLMLVELELMLMVLGLMLVVLVVLDKECKIGCFQN